MSDYVRQDPEDCLKNACHWSHPETIHSPDRGHFRGYSRISSPRAQIGLPPRGLELSSSQIVIDWPRRRTTTGTSLVSGSETALRQEECRAPSRTRSIQDRQYCTDGGDSLSTQ